MKWLARKNKYFASHIFSQPFIQFFFSMAPFLSLRRRTHQRFTCCVWYRRFKRQPLSHYAVLFCRLSPNSSTTTNIPTQWHPIQTPKSTAQKSTLSDRTFQMRKLECLMALSQLYQLRKVRPCTQVAFLCKSYVAFEPRINRRLLIWTFKYYLSSGELVEKGVMRRLPDGFDGNTCPYIFTWSIDRPNNVSCPKSSSLATHNFSLKGQCDK